METGKRIYMTDIVDWDINHQHKQNKQYLAMRMVNAVDPVQLLCMLYLYDNKQVGDTVAFISA